MSKLDDLNGTIDELEKKITAEAKDAIGEAFAEFFAAYPTVHGVRWTQYTPHFNDGDACVFGVHDFYYQLVAEKDEQDEDGETDRPGKWHYASSYGTPSAESVAASALRKKIGASKIFLAAFNDHVAVTATRDGFEVEEYEHD